MKFYQGSYFPPNFKYIGYLGLFGSVVLTLVGNVVVGIPVLLMALGLSFTMLGCNIDIKSKTITDFISVLGIVFGQAEKYSELKKILLKENEISQVLNSRGSSTTLRYTIYNAYLFYDDGSVLLTGDKNKMVA